mmetsp:Transcript_40151/g.126956  ORF Transcript_40151/g.126956 Transcript_40151/m.126956 type:complete len:207 (+) Transcript_40151:155-775(+)
MHAGRLVPLLARGRVRRRVRAHGRVPDGRLRIRWRRWLRRPRWVWRVRKPARRLCGWLPPGRRRHGRIRRRRRLRRRRRQLRVAAARPVRRRHGWLRHGRRNGRRNGRPGGRIPGWRVRGEPGERHRQLQRWRWRRRRRRRRLQRHALARRHAGRRPRQRLRAGRRAGGVRGPAGRTAGRELVRRKDKGLVRASGGRGPRAGRAAG